MARRAPGLQLATGNFRQSRAMCGPACLKIVFRFFGRHVSESHIAKACRTSSKTGTTGSNLVKAAQRFGFDAELVDHSDFRTIAKWLRMGVPVIVDWMSTISSGRGCAPMACGHYSVVCGLDSEYIVLQDPAIGRRRRVSRSSFLRVWYDFKLLFPKTADDLIIRRAIVVVSKSFGRFAPLSAPADIRKPCQNKRRVGSMGTLLLARG
jgi:ABC-type bacteriocin/lantibiotic exporter with double-glycine peptidase domain